jgi:hypothetical protein
VVASFSFSIETVSYSDEAQRIAVNMARLPELLGLGQRDGGSAIDTKCPGDFCNGFSGADALNGFPPLVRCELLLPTEAHAARMARSRRPYIFDRRARRTTNRENMRFDGGPINLR